MQGSCQEHVILALPAAYHPSTLLSQATKVSGLLSPFIQQPIVNAQASKSPLCFQLQDRQLKEGEGEGWGRQSLGKAVFYDYFSTQ